MGVFQNELSTVIDGRAYPDRCPRCDAPQAHLKPAGLTFSRVKFECGSFGSIRGVFSPAACIIHSKRCRESTDRSAQYIPDQMRSSCAGRLLWWYIEWLTLTEPSMGSQEQQVQVQVGLVLTLAVHYLEQLPDRMPAPVAPAGDADLREMVAQLKAGWPDLDDGQVADLGAVMTSKTAILKQATGGDSKLAHLAVALDASDHAVDLHIDVVLDIAAFAVACRMHDMQVADGGDNS